MPEECEIKEPRRTSLTVAAALLLALLAPALGGGTSATAEGVLLSGIGLVVIMLPARGVRTGFLIGAGLVLVATLDWAWPARLVELGWRGRLEEAGFPLAWCCSPEPWVSLRGGVLLLGGLVWAEWCVGQVWTSGGRRAVCEGLASGIGGIALVALSAHHVPGWPAGTGLGPFENRNQTAMLFAMGAFLTVVCGVERMRELGCERRIGAAVLLAVAWFCVLGIYTAALAINRSRSGPALLVAMTVAWFLTVTPLWKRRPETLAVGVAMALLLGTVVLMTGHGLIARLTENPIMDFRLKIFSDTLALIRASPWTGTGLGCFDAIFPLYRNASILQERVLHPESDWLWLTAEAGVPGLLAVAGLAGCMGVQVWRRAEGGVDRALRVALGVACAGMLAHSFADVPGHRLGTMMPALLLLGLAVGDDERRQDGSVLSYAGVVVLAIGAGWLTAMGLGIATPLVNGEAMLAVRAAKDEAAGRNADAEAEMNKAVEWAPLSWQLYVERAQAEGANGELTAALGDFRRARFLEPNYAGLPFTEGVYWLERAPRFAIEAWEEALTRFPRERRSEMYQNMLADAFTSHPELHGELWSLAASDAATELIYFSWATPEEFKERMDEVLHEDPALDRYGEEQLKRLFPIWMNKGDAQRLQFLMERKPEWKRMLEGK